MKPAVRPRQHPSGFSLGEMLVTVVIGGMILTVILGIYGRANRAADAVLQKIESPSQAAEVLQLIGEDIDRILAADDVSLQVRNGFDNGFVRAELVLRRTYHDKENKEQVLEEITWRAGYDYEGDVPGLVIYRSREGIGGADKLLENQREDWERNYPFVPICRGATFFQVQAYKGEELVDQWPLGKPPSGVQVTISFAESYETVRGTRDVLDEMKTSRTFAVDAMRKIKFAAKSSGDTDQAGTEEETADGQTPSDQDREAAARKASELPRGRAGERTNNPPRGSVTNERTPTQIRPR